MFTLFGLITSLLSLLLNFMSYIAREGNQLFVVHNWMTYSQLMIDSH